MRVRSFGLLGRILLILVFVAATEFLANTLVFERTSQFALQDDDAHRMAEHLTVVRRVMDGAAPAEREAMAQELSTARFAIMWQRHMDQSSATYGLNNLRSQIVEFEPALLPAKLRLHLMPLREGGDIGGSMELTDHSTVSFRASQTRLLWSLTFGRILGLIAPTLALLIVGGLMIRATLRPLRVLMRATKQVGMREVHMVPEAGPSEIRNLIHDFNVMQTRIHRLLATRTQALAAVGHDLRTPLARLKLRLANIDLDRETQDQMSEDIDEMGDLLRSLQIYLGGEGQKLPQEKIDLAVMASTLVDSARDAGHDAYLHAPASLETWLRPVAIRRSLSNLIDNAIHYGGNARVSILPDETEILIHVDDDGPGIPADKMAEVLQPFVRLDGARTRNTSGMGLGLAIVQDAILAEGGVLELKNRPEGGLRVTIRLPRRLHDPSTSNISLHSSAVAANFTA